MIRMTSSGSETVGGAPPTGSERSCALRTRGDEARQGARIARVTSKFRMIRCRGVKDCETGPRCNRFTVNRGGVCKVCLNLKDRLGGVLPCR